MSDRISVLVVDDHPVYREGLVRGLREQPDLEIVGALGDGREALDEIRRLDPAVALVDLQLPGLDGIAIVDALQHETVTTRAILLTAFEDSATVYRAFATGARGYLHKLSSPEAIHDAIRTVGRGGAVIPPELHTALTGELRLRRERGDDGPPLSDRELQVLRLVADGNGVAEIAAELHLGATTVKTHLRHVYEKLETTDRAAAVAAAFRRGLLR